MATSKAGVTKMKSSVWQINANVLDAVNLQPTFPKFFSEGTEHYDVVVVGGGMFGCTAAYLFKESGKKVALLEARTIGNNTTGCSTAKLSAQQGPTYQMIAKQRGQDMARAYYDMNMSGIRKVEELVRVLNLDCELETRSHTTWTSLADKMPMIREEYDVCTNIGVPNVSLLDGDALRAELPNTLEPKLGVRFEGQAQFNSFKFCQELAKQIVGDGSAVFEDSRVETVSENNVVPVAPHSVTVGNGGGTLTADVLVLATHLPLVNRSMHFAIVEPARSLCVAVRIPEAEKKMHNMFINADMPKRSLRTTQDDSVIVVSGEGFKQGDTTDTEALYDNLVQWSREHWNVQEVVTRWSAFDYYSSDHVPFIGYLHRSTRSVFTATGMNKWGLALAVSGAELIVDLAHGRENKTFHTLVDALRWDHQGSQFKGLTMEGIHTGKHLIGDKLKRFLPGKKNIQELQPGEGGIVALSKLGKKVGAYRDPEGHLHVVEPVCTHLGCDVVFNNGDCVWDCPCHGSQFGVDGSVLQGPATKPLCVLKDIEW